jgi:hypothetical protein
MKVLTKVPRHTRLALSSDGLVKIDLLEQVVLFDIGQQLGGRGEVVAVVAGGEVVVDVKVVVAGEGDLLQVIGRLGPGGRLADFQEGGEK